MRDSLNPSPPLRKFSPWKSSEQATPNYAAVCLLDKLISEVVCKILQDLLSESPELKLLGLPGGGPVFKTAYFYCSGHGSHPWLGTKILHAMWVSKRKKT